MSTRSDILCEMQQIVDEIDNNNYVAKKLYDLCEKKFIHSSKHKGVLVPAVRKKNFEIYKLEPRIFTREPLSFAITFLASVIKKFNRLLIYFIYPMLDFFSWPQTRTTSVQASVCRFEDPTISNPLIHSYILHSCNQMVKYNQNIHKIIPTSLSQHEICELLGSHNLSIGDSCIETQYEKREKYNDKVAETCLDYNPNQTMFDEAMVDTYYYESHHHDKEPDEEFISNYSYYKGGFSEKSSTVFNNSHISIQSLP